MSQSQTTRLLYTSHFVQFLAGLFLALLFLLAGYFNWQAQDRELNHQLETAADELKAAASVSLSDLQQQMLGLGQLILLDQQTQQHIEAAWRAWQEEGEGSGGAQTQHQRQQLYAHLEPVWSQLNQSLGIHQMQLHFMDRQGRNRSFLRMHAPQQYGDDLTQLRPIIDTTHATGQAASGFEVGRFASGVRGAMPVNLPTIERSVVFELGTQLELKLRQLDQQFNAGFAVILKEDQVAVSQLPDAYQGRGYQIGQCHYYLEASSRAGLDALLQQMTQCERDFESGHWQLFSLDDTTYQIIQTQLDHPLSTDHRVDTLIWRDISGLLAGQQATQRQLLIHLGAIWLALQLMLMLGLYLTGRGMRLRLRRTRDELADSVARLNALIRHFRACVLFESAERRVLHINQAFCAYFCPDQLPEQMVGKKTTELLPVYAENFADPDSALAMIEQRVTNCLEVQNEEVHLADGRVFERDYVPVHRDGRLFGHLWVYRDISQLKAQQKALKYMARTDSLTDLPNRRYFMQKLTDEALRIQRTGEGASLVMFDLDHFKQINDNWGHAVGDEVLRLLARRVRKTLRASDFAARLGGEEFAVLLPSTPTEGANIFAERLRRLIADTPFETSTGAIDVTISLGISHLTQLDKLPEEALQRADKALYLAKNRGRNRVQVFQLGDSNPLSS